MALNGSQLASEIVTALEVAGKLPGLSASDKSDLEANLAITYGAVVSHIVANLEINGVQISDPSATVETYTAGVGTNGGSLTGQIPVNGSVVKPSQTLAQSNGGTGLVQ